jgi:hypothetical protein
MLRNAKMKFAWAVITCTLGLLAIGIAWATPGVGISTTIIAGPAVLDEVHLNSMSEINDVKIKTKGLSDVYVVRNVIVPGGTPAGTPTQAHPSSPSFPGPRPSIAAMILLAMCTLLAPHS